ncbi:type II toxin-antitoxin system VapC family toxin [candidate division KSB1 bacterium]|nr:type II toxin-antitoxin system VapC family toxin [candidate division KSB1 bacterium]
MNDSRLRILDTDTLSAYHRGHPEVVARYSALPLVLRAITVVTAEEVLRGRFAQINQAKKTEKLILAYDFLREAVVNLSRIRILRFDEQAASRYGRIKSLKTRVGTLDLRIAAIALSNNAILITANQRHFRQVPELITEDWTVATS